MAGRRREPRNAREAIDALLGERLEVRGFAPALEAEAGRAADAAEDSEIRRRDLTELPTFTIDPATARDFDDAISAQREQERPPASGIRIIAEDAAAPMRHATDLNHLRGGAPRRHGDTDAAAAFKVGRLAPALPGGRGGVTAEIEFSPSGAPCSASFYRSRIRSRARLDYDQLDLIFAGRDSAPESVAEPLGMAREAAAALGERQARPASTPRPPSPIFASARAEKSSPPIRSSRPVAPLDRAADDPRQRTGGAAA